MLRLSIYTLCPRHLSSHNSNVTTAGTRRLRIRHCVAFPARGFLLEAVREIGWEEAKDIANKQVLNVGIYLHTI